MFSKIRKHLCPPESPTNESGNRDSVSMKPEHCEDLSSLLSPGGPQTLLTSSSLVPLVNPCPRAQEYMSFVLDLKGTVTDTYTFSGEEWVPGKEKIPTKTILILLLIHPLRRENVFAREL